jgi:hypothetical protein
MQICDIENSDTKNYSIAQVISILRIRKAIKKDRLIAQLAYFSDIMHPGASSPARFHAVLCTHRFVMTSTTTPLWCLATPLTLSSLFCFNPTEPKNSPILMPDQPVPGSPFTTRMVGKVEQSVTQEPITAVVARRVLGNR